MQAETTFFNNKVTLFDFYHTYDLFLILQCQEKLEAREKLMQKDIEVCSLTDYLQILLEN